MLWQASLDTFVSAVFSLVFTPGEPFGLMEYYAPCYSNGSLAVLFFGISQNGRNILASPNNSASFAIQSPPTYSLATKPRVGLVGSFEVFPRDYENGETLKKCYLASHPDAWWVPGNKAGVHDVSAGQRSSGHI